MGIQQTLLRGLAPPPIIQWYGSRGVFIGGRDPGFSDTMDYVTIASAGSASNFGDISTAKANGNAFGNSTRGAYCGGQTGPAGNTWTNDTLMVRFASLGNSTDFGDRTVASYSASGTSDNTRGVFTGGDGPTTNVIDFVTMASAGNATDFGDLVTANGSSHADTSDSIIGCIAGGVSNTNAIEKITIQTLGNAIDYGDLTSGRSQLGATSDSHGGLS